MAQENYVALVGGNKEEQAQWIDYLQTHLPEPYILEQFDTKTGYVTRLADLRVAVVFVLDDDKREFWAATPKSSPATRRIPIILVSEQNLPEMLRSGVDVIISPEELQSSLATILKNYARVPSSEEIKQLACDCDEPLPPLAQQGVEKFNTGEYYKQHDLFEELWVQTEGPVRDLYRAILQVGVAYFQIQRGNHRGALKMLLRSVQWLTVLPDECQGINVKALREDSYRVRAMLEELGEDRIDQFDMSLLQPVKRVSTYSK